MGKCESTGLEEVSQEWKNGMKILFQFVLCVWVVFNSGRVVRYSQGDMWSTEGPQRPKLWYLQKYRIEQGNCGCEVAVIWVKNVKYIGYKKPRGVTDNYVIFKNPNPALAGAPADVDYEVQVINGVRTIVDVNEQAKGR